MNNAGHAICKLMGFKGAFSSHYGKIWKIQEDYGVLPHSLTCSTTDWSSCSLKSTMKLKACKGHTRDLFLTCSGTRSPFTLVNSAGSQVSGHQQFLLLYNGGTVCGDQFSDNSAEAICRNMGYSGAESWRLSWPFEKLDYKIALDDVNCSYGDWGYCNFSTSHNCVHNKDVYLSCKFIPDVKYGPFVAICTSICIGMWMYAKWKNSKINQLVKEKADIDTLVKKLERRLKKLKIKKGEKSSRSGDSSDEHDEDK